MPFSTPPGKSGGGNVGPGNENELAVYDASGDVNGVSDLLWDPAITTLGINGDVVVNGDVALETLSLPTPIGTVLDDSGTGTRIDIKKSDGTHIGYVQAAPASKLAIVADDEITITPGGTAKAVITRPNIPTVAAAAAGDIGMAASGRATNYIAARGFAQTYAVPGDRPVANVGDIADYLSDIVGTIATSSATTIDTVGIGTGKAVMFEINAVVKFQDETAFCNIFRRGSVVNNGGTLTIALGTAVNTSGGTGAANIDGDTVLGVVSGTNVNFQLDPETATARDYRFILKAWELA